MGCAPGKPAIQPASDPTIGRAGTVPQAVKQMAAVEDKEENAKLVAAAGEAVAKAEPLKLMEYDGVWRAKDGAALESALEADPEHGDSPVRLVDARYIVELSKRGGKIVRRQELPEEAFIGLDTLKRLDEGRGGCLRVIAISHPWQQPDHPDPKEVNLTLLAKVLERFLYEDGEGTTYAVFFE